MPQNTPRSYQKLQAALAATGYFRRGTLLKRFMRCGKRSCACHRSPPSLHGPYYQWTRKVGGKTVTVRLTAQQAALVANWIAAGRELDRIVAQMEHASLRATERILSAMQPPGRQRLHPSRRKRAELPDKQ